MSECPLEKPEVRCDASNLPYHSTHAPWAQRNRVRHRHLKGARYRRRLGCRTRPIIRRRLLKPSRNGLSRAEKNIHLAESASLPTDLSSTLPDIWSARSP